MELNLIVIYLYNLTIILCSSSSYFPSLDLVQRVDSLAKITRILTTEHFYYFSLNLTMHTKADLQIAHCAHRVCALVIIRNAFNWICLWVTIWSLEYNQGIGTDRRISECNRVQNHHRYMHAGSGTVLFRVSAWSRCRGRHLAMSL